MVKIDSTTVVMIVGCGILLSIAVWFFFFRDSKPKNEAMVALNPSKEPITAVQPQPSSGNDPALILFYGEHCPHCHAMMPAWTEVKKALVGKLGVTEIEGQDPKMANFTPPKGVPTIRYYPAGPENQHTFVDYHGDRSAQSLVNFALSGGQQ